jgi:hypothetical protein
VCFPSPESPSYGATERAIQELLKENGSRDAEQPVDDIVVHGIEAPPSTDQRSPESYIGYHLAERFASPGGLRDNREKAYEEPSRLNLNHWGLIGPWNVNAESAVLVSTPGKVVYRFHSRDLNLVMAPSKDGRPIRFKVTLDGAVPGNDCGVDSSPDGTGTVREPVCISSFDKPVRLKTAPSRSNSSTPACKLWTLHSAELRFRRLFAGPSARWPKLRFERA